MVLIKVPRKPSEMLIVLCLHLQIHIIDFDDENNIINKNVLLHQAGEIWHISASPADKGVLATCYNKSKCCAYCCVGVSWKCHVRVILYC